MTTALRKTGDRHKVQTPLSALNITFLDHMRQAGRDARCKGQIDLFGACAALSGTCETGGQSASDVLVRCLAQALGRRPVLLRATEHETSFDENWLIALARSLKRNDSASVTFLLNSQVPKPVRRQIVLLMHRIIDRFETI